ncbi:MAG: hypothetical protein JWN10_2911 [Solirubrobacterales bacterium]|nr:hypothetical protein [Solirubrobacterales bacterium]
MIEAVAAVITPEVRERADAARLRCTTRQAPWLSWPAEPSSGEVEDFERLVGAAPGFSLDAYALLERIMPDQLATAINAIDRRHSNYAAEVRAVIDGALDTAEALSHLCLRNRCVDAPVTVGFSAFLQLGIDTLAAYLQQLRGDPTASAHLRELADGLPLESSPIALPHFAGTITEELERRREAPRPLVSIARSAAPVLAFILASAPQDLDEHAWHLAPIAATLLEQGTPATAVVASGVRCLIDAALAVDRQATHRIVNARDHQHTKALDAFERRMRRDVALPPPGHIDAVADHSLRLHADVFELNWHRAAQQAYDLARIALAENSHKLTATGAPDSLRAVSRKLASSDPLVADALTMLAERPLPSMRHAAAHMSFAPRFDEAGTIENLQSGDSADALALARSAGGSDAAALGVAIALVVARIDENLGREESWLQVQLARAILADGHLPLIEAETDGVTLRLRTAPQAEHALASHAPRAAAILRDALPGITKVIILDTSDETVAATQ